MKIDRNISCTIKAKNIRRGRSIFGKRCPFLRIKGITRKESPETSAPITIKRVIPTYWRVRLCIQGTGRKI
jgi:hypothetical protein